MSLFDTMSIYHVPETDDSRALNMFFGFFKVLVMIFPPALLGLFTIIHKYQERKRLAEEEKQLEDEEEKKEEEEDVKLLEESQSENCRKRKKERKKDKEL